MAALTTEERLTVLESEVEKLKQRQEPDKSLDEIPWWKKMVGVFKDNPNFEEAVRLGREWRESPDPSEEE